MFGPPKYKFLTPPLEATACLFTFHGAHAIVIANVQDEKGHNLAMDGGFRV